MFFSKSHISDYLWRLNVGIGLIYNNEIGEYKQHGCTSQHFQHIHYQYYLVSHPSLLFTWDYFIS